MDSRLERLLHEVLARTDAGQPLSREWLREHYPGDHEELTELLAIEGLLGEIAPPPGRVGPYRILRELGRGGMGTVYLAEVAGPGPGLRRGERVAVKVVHLHLLGRRGVAERFRREVEIGRSVRHENVVRVLDFGTSAGKPAQVYLVMEYVEGRTLRALLEESGRLPEAFCTKVAREVARALVAIHAAGAIHRDVKPANILLTDDGVVKLMDLGVAWLASKAARLSATGAFVGSLLYAAPEQLRAGSRLDGRSDLYALGLTLFELAAGEHWFACGTVAALRPRVSPFFEEVVQTLLARDRDARFATADELDAVLEAGEASEWWRCRSRTAPGRAPAAGGRAADLRDARGPEALQRLRPALERLEAEQCHAAASELSEQALAVPGLLAGAERVELLARHAACLVRLGRHAAERAALAEALDLAAAIAEPVPAAGAKRKLGEVLLRRARGPEAIALFASACELAGGAGDAGLEARARDGLGRALYSVGRVEAAAAQLRRALELAREAREVGAEAQAAASLAAVLHLLGRIDEARAWAETGLALSRKIGDGACEARACRTLGALRVRRGAFDEARGFHERALVLARDAGDAGEAAAAMLALGGVHCVSGRVAAAVTWTRQALLAAVDSGSVRIEAACHKNLAHLYQQEGKLAGALRHIERAISALQACHDLVQLALALQVHGDVLKQLGDLEAAGKVYDESLDLVRAAGARRIEGRALAAQLEVDALRGAGAGEVRRRGREVAGKLRAAGTDALVPGVLLCVAETLARAGESAAARACAAEAAALADRLDIGVWRVLAACRRASLQAGSAAPAITALRAHGASLAPGTEMEARFLLWQATSDRRHLRAAHRLQRALLRGAPARYRCSMVRDLPLHRDLAAAWSARAT